MKKYFVLAGMACLSAQSFAGADCPKADKSTWMSEHDFQKMAVNELGMTIYKFKIDGECYEIYGLAPRDGEDKKVEIYFNPVNGEIVKEKAK